VKTGRGGGGPLGTRAWRDDGGGCSLLIASVV
jgi:hypothetical protein